MTPNPQDKPERGRQVRYKGCDCVGTSSGPRVVNVRYESGPYLLSEARMVAFACDVCDAPWSEWMDPPATEPAP